MQEFKKLTLLEFIGEVQEIENLNDLKFNLEDFVIQEINEISKIDENKVNNLEIIEQQNNPGINEIPNKDRELSEITINENMPQKYERKPYPKSFYNNYNISYKNNPPKEKIVQDMSGVSYAMSNSFNPTDMKELKKELGSRTIVLRSNVNFKEVWKNYYVWSDDCLGNKNYDAPLPLDKVLSMGQDGIGNFISFGPLSRTAIHFTYKLYPQLQKESEYNEDISWICKETSAYIQGQMPYTHPDDVQEKIDSFAKLEGCFEITGSNRKMQIIHLAFLINGTDSRSSHVLTGTGTGKPRHLAMALAYFLGAYFEQMPRDTKQPELFQDVEVNVIHRRKKNGEEYAWTVISSVEKKVLIIANPMVEGKDAVLNLTNYKDYLRACEIYNKKFVFDTFNRYGRLDELLALELQTLEEDPTNQDTMDAISLLLGEGANPNFIPEDKDKPSVFVYLNPRLNQVKKIPHQDYVNIFEKLVNQWIKKEDQKQQLTQLFQDETLTPKTKMEQVLSYFFEHDRLVFDILSKLDYDFLVNIKKKNEVNDIKEQIHKEKYPQEFLIEQNQTEFSIELVLEVLSYQLFNDNKTKEQFMILREKVLTNFNNPEKALQDMTTDIENLFYEVLPTVETSKKNTKGISGSHSSYSGSRTLQYLFDKPVKVLMKELTNVEKTLLEALRTQNTEKLIEMQDQLREEELKQKEAKEFIQLTRAFLVNVESVNGHTNLTNIVNNETLNDLQKKKQLMQHNPSQSSSKFWHSEKYKALIEVHNNGLYAIKTGDIKLLRQVVGEGDDDTLTHNPKSRLYRS